MADSEHPAAPEPTSRPRAQRDSEMTEEGKSTEKTGAPALRRSTTCTAPAPRPSTTVCGEEPAHMQSTSPYSWSSIKVTAGSCVATRSKSAHTVLCRTRANRRASSPCRRCASPRPHSRPSRSRPRTTCSPAGRPRRQPHSPHRLDNIATTLPCRAMATDEQRSAHCARSDTRDDE